jgi:hypothetical protein
VRPSPVLDDADPSCAGTGVDPQASPDDLAAVLPRKVPGFQAIDGPGADHYLGRRDPAEFRPDPIGEVALLDTQGFRGGWIRAFRNPANDVAVTSVYQFEDADTAGFHLEDGLILIGGYGGQFLDIESLPGVRGFRQEIDHEGMSLISLGAAFQAGPRWFLTYLLGSPETVTPDALVGAVMAHHQLMSGPEPSPPARRDHPECQPPCSPRR